MNIAIVNSLSPLELMSTTIAQYRQHFYAEALTETENDLLAEEIATTQTAALMDLFLGVPA